MINKKVFIILISFIFISQEIFCLDYSKRNKELEDIKLISGDMTIIDAYEPQRVAIRDPNIADVQKVDEKGITVIAKNKGSTVVQFWDKTGEHLRIIRVVPVDIQALTRQIEKILYKINMPDILTQPVEEEGKILLMGKLKRASDKKKIEMALGDLWAYVTDLIEIDDSSLVEISVELLELDSDAQKTLGIAYNEYIKLSEVVPTPAGAALSTFLNAKIWQRNPADSFYTATFNFLVQEGKAKVLSRPKVVCQSGKEAELLVGGEEPNMKTDVVGIGGSSTSIEYKEYGIKLNIKPEVLEAGRIQLNLNIEVSEIKEAVVLGTVASPTARAVPLVKRNMNTQLYLSDGETLAIGGLLRQKEEEDLKKLPWLGDLPFLGPLFRNRETKKGGGRTKRGDIELFVTISPRIIYTTSNEAAGKKSSSRFSSFTDSRRDNNIGQQYKKSSAVPNELNNYISEVQKKVLKNISYPSILLNTGWEGQVVVKLVIEDNGTLKDAKLQKSSGYTIFDEETMNLVKNLTYPPFPPDVYVREVEISIPIMYQGKKK